MFGRNDDLSWQNHVVTLSSQVLVRRLQISARLFPLREVHALAREPKRVVCLLLHGANLLLSCDRTAEAFVVTVKPVLRVNVLETNTLVTLPLAAGVEVDLPVVSAVRSLHRSSVVRAHLEVPADGTPVKV